MSYEHIKKIKHKRNGVISFDVEAPFNSISEYGSGYLNYDIEKNDWFHIQIGGFYIKQWTDEDFKEYHKNIKNYITGNEIIRIVSVGNNISEITFKYDDWRKEDKKHDIFKKQNTLQDVMDENEELKNENAKL